MQLRDLAGDFVIETFIAGQGTAGTDDEWALFTAPFDATVTACAFTPNAAITGDNTNYFTAKVWNRRTDGAGVLVPASLAFLTGVNGVAFDAKALTLSGTAADLVVTEGDIVTFAKVKTASGLAMPDGLVSVTLRGRG